MWEMFRAGTIGELENIPEEQLDFRPGDGARSVRELILHILGSSQGFVTELLADDTTFMRLRNPAKQAELIASMGNPQTKAELVELVKSTGATNMQRLRDASAQLEASTMAMGDITQSKASGIFFAASHEMYHRGQLTSYARAMGVVPQMTQRILALSK